MIKFLKSLFQLTKKQKKKKIASCVLSLIGMALERVVKQGRYNKLRSVGGLYNRYWEKREKARGWKIAKVGLNAG